VLRDTKGKQVTPHGVSFTTEGHRYSFVVDTTAQVRELLLNTTAPVSEVVVIEEGYKQARILTTEEVLAIVLNHPKPVLSLA
jgi:hypothetical protein